MLLPRKKKDFHNTPPKRLAVELRQENTNADMHGNLQKNSLDSSCPGIFRMRPIVHLFIVSITHILVLNLFFSLFLQQSRIK